MEIQNQLQRYRNLGSRDPKMVLLIMCQCNETGTAGFEASRKSTNDGLAHEGIGDLEAKCASLQEAQAAIAAWHQYRYGDNDVEFAE